MSRHMYATDPDVPPDHRGEGRCWCGLPKANRAHELPPASTEHKEQLARYDREAGPA